MQSERSDTAQGKEVGGHLPASFTLEKLRGPKLEVANRGSRGRRAGTNQNQRLVRAKMLDLKAGDVVAPEAVMLSFFQGRRGWLMR